MINFRKKDEMEQEIQNKSILVSYYFTSVLLIIWVIRNIIIKQSAVLPLYVLIMQYIVKKVSELFYKYSVDDNRWKKALAILLITVILILFLLIISPIAVRGLR